MKKKKKAKRWTSWYFRPFRLTLLLWALLIALYIFPVSLGYFLNIEIFWYYEYSRMLCLAPFFAALILSYFTPIIWVRRTHQALVPQISKANFIVLLILGILFLTIVGLPPLNAPQHFATAKTEGHIYYLGYIESYSASSNYITYFYKCDRIGLFCTRLCGYPIDSVHDKEKFGLRSNTQTRSVTLTLNSQPICIYSEKSGRVRQYP